MLKDILIKSYEFNLLYAKQIVSDLDNDLMTTSGGKGLENHPAFTLGHLITASALTAKYFNGTYNISSEWESLFRRTGPGDPKLPELNSELYPNKDLLLSELTKHHKIVENLIQDLNETQFKKEIKWRFAKHMPTLGDLLYFMCITHESMHLGQLAGWRRAMKLPSALARL